MVSRITTHVLDTTRGQPAVGVAVMLQILRANGTWEPVGSGVTGTDGRVSELLSQDAGEVGRFRLQFATDDYFSAYGMTSFFPVITVEFAVQDLSRRYHIPLLLSPYGYTTYRGT